MKRKHKKILLYLLGILVLAGGLLGLAKFWPEPSLAGDLENYGEAGSKVLESMTRMPALEVKEEKIEGEDGEKEVYKVKDTEKIGPEIWTEKEGEEKLKGLKEGEERGLEIVFPKKLKQEPLEIKLNEMNSVLISDESEESYSMELVKEKEQAGFLERFKDRRKNERGALENGGLEQGGIDLKRFVKYRSSSGRKTIYYAYQKDAASQKKVLKQWTIYEKGSGEEKESYTIDNAKLKKNEKGEVEVYYFGETEKKNEEVLTQVDQSLIDRMNRTLEKEFGENIENGDRAPDFVIPKPYYLDKDGKGVDLEWFLNEAENKISYEIKTEKDRYPLAVDPTVYFYAWDTFYSREFVIKGNTGNLRFGYALATGNMDGDSDTDLIVGAYEYNTNQGRVYIFYNDGSYYPIDCASADVTITGESSSDFFGYFQGIEVGDLDGDNDDDFAVAAFGYNAGGYQGRVYLFYNDGSWPTTAATADTIITGEASSRFGYSLAIGNLDDDSDDDLAVGAYTYSSSAGRAYIFYNDGSYPTTAATADVIITGEAGSYFGYGISIGGLDGDSDDDLIIGGYQYNSAQGRAYIFYNDGSYPTTAASADVIITGEAASGFGLETEIGDLDSDGDDDLVIGAYAYSSSTGRTYVFYNDGYYSTTAASADIILSGQASSIFGVALSIGDLDTDGNLDLVVGAATWSVDTGYLTIYFSHGRRVVQGMEFLTGEGSSNFFGGGLAAGDLDDDGKLDLVVAAYGYNSNQGRVYIFYNESASYPSGPDGADVTITGESTGDYFSASLATGDLDGDNDDDLAIGAYGYNSNQGRAYIFYNDGSYPTAASSADVTITGQSASNYFGYGIATGDLDGDNDDDLVTGAYTYNSGQGRAYIFYNDGSYPTAAVDADVVITGESSNNYFGFGIATGDLDGDNDDDLAIGAYGYNSNQGRAYIFYNDGSYATAAASADVIITGEASSAFGVEIGIGNLDSDSDDDLVVAASSYNSSQGRIYIFYNDGSYATAAASADSIITGYTTSNYFGRFFDLGDLDGDGDTDLAVAGFGYSSNRGSAFIYYNDGSYPASAIDADVMLIGESTGDYFGYVVLVAELGTGGNEELVVGAAYYHSNQGRIYIYHSQRGITTSDDDKWITGESGSSFGYAVRSGDLDGDNDDDLVVGGYSYNSGQGRAYIFYNDGSYPTAASSADVIITGETGTTYFGISLAVGNLDGDSDDDLVVGASGYNSNQGRAYIFYNDGSYATAAASADVIITGEASSNFGYVDAMEIGDLDGDSDDDLVVGAQSYNSSQGRAYIFYNDGSYATAASSADVIITGTTSSAFGRGISIGDLGDDSDDDLAIGAYAHSTNMGYIAVFYNDGSYPSSSSGADLVIYGAASNYLFGVDSVIEDFDGDGDDDLAVGGNYYNTYQGRVYVFYNDGSYPTSSNSADAILTGETTNNFFGALVDAGDIDNDGDTDLLSSAYRYNNNYVGRAYIFYNDGQYPSAGLADVYLEGDAINNSFGCCHLAVGDMDDNGTEDLVVPAYQYNSNQGRVFIFNGRGGTPTVTTQAATNIQPQAALAHGTVTDTGGATITTRGFKYGLTETDTWDVNEAGSFGAEAFELTLPSLSPGTLYWFRAYATSSEGTSYGSYLSFTTDDAADVVIFRGDVILKNEVEIK